MQSMQVLQEIVQLMEKPLQVIQLTLCLFAVICIGREITRKEESIYCTDLFFLWCIILSILACVGYISFGLFLASEVYLILYTYHENPQNRILLIFMIASSIACVALYVLLLLV